MEAIITAIVSFLLIDPLKAEMVDKLASARAPQPVIAEVTACAGTAVPLIVERATSDPWWAATRVYSAWVGTTGTEALLIEVAPGCSGAVRAARPFLAGDRA